jgi:tetratricopeptide (TPR) repeat protein
VSEPSGQGDKILVQLEQALAAHRAGDLAGARLAYARIPVDHSAYAEALHGLGQIAVQEGDGADAERLIQSALELRPNLTQAHYHLALALGLQKRWPEAVAAWHRALERNPHDAASWRGLGQALLSWGKPGEAVEATRQALKFDRNNPDLWAQCGDALRAAGNVSEASNYYERALQRDAEHLAALANLGALKQESGDAAAAVVCLERAQAVHPDAKEVLNTLGIAYRALGRDVDAERAFRRSVECDPEFAIAWNGLGTALEDLGRLDEAEAAIRAALAIDSGYANAWIGLGNVLKRSGRHTDALAAYRQALLLAPDSPAAHWNFGLMLLLLGDLAGGFAEFEWRLKLPQAKALYPDLGIPYWQGEPLAGKRILLFAEQGLGDTLQFIRYAPLLARQGAEVSVVCPAPLLSLIKRVDGVAAASAAIPPGGDASAADFACPMMSLPHCLGTTLETIPAADPYLQAEPVLQRKWQERLTDDGTALRVGLVWAGDPRPNDPDANRVDRRRSLPLHAPDSWLEIPGVRWYSLQKGSAAQQAGGGAWRGRLTDWTSELADFDQTAALVAGLDLIISVDTAVVHLAAGLGKPTWVLSRFDGCWRWLLGRDTSPWYASLRLYRQVRPGDWAPPIASVGADLAAWVRRRDRST